MTGECVDGVAIRTADKKYIYIRFKPFRHRDCYDLMYANKESEENIHGGEEGFITSEGRFVSRVEAWTIALASNQVVGDKTIYNTPKGPELYSEHLWTNKVPESMQNIKQSPEIFTKG